MSKRADIYRQSAIEPSEYHFVACDYLGGGFEGASFLPERIAFRAHMTMTGGKFGQSDHAGTCYICGAGALYVAKFHHVPTNTYIVTGMDCAAKMDMGDARAFDSFRKKIKAGIEAATGRAKAQRILSDAGASAAWTIYTAPDMQGFKYEESTIFDIVGKLVRYGSISEKQMTLIVSLLDKIDGRAALAAKRAEENAMRAPIPTTANDRRVSITGKVLSVKEVETDFGPATKILVEHADGWRVYGTRPSGLNIDNDALKGCLISFDARVTISENDSKFGFFSRPTKGALMETSI